MGEWQPIETASHDRAVLLWNSKTREIRVGYWADGGGWADPWSGRFETPTHWTDLPEPPTDKP